jgi:hypothetical protein
MSVQTTVDSLKRQALQEILKNVNIPSVYILTKLNLYIAKGAQTTFSMTRLASIDAYKPTSGDVNAKILFSYLEIYTSYVLGFTSSELFNSLSSLTSSKYEYVIRRYKEIIASIRAKELEKEYKWNIFVDFSVPTNIYLQAFTSNKFDVASMARLSYKDVLSLPIIKTENIIPDETFAHIEDSSVSVIDQDKSRDYVFCKLYRMVGEKLGRVFGANSIKKWDDTQGQGPFPFLSGSTNGFICNEFHLQISRIVDISETEQDIYYRTSLDGLTWSEETVTNDIRTENVISLAGGISTGLKFKFLENHMLTEGSTWTIAITYVTLEDPICRIKSVFNSIYYISYIKFNDLSLHKLLIDSKPLLKDTETSAGTLDVPVTNRDISQIIPLNNTLYSMELPLTQTKSSITSKNGNLAYMYDFNISDITAVMNKYSNYGVALFDPLTVDNVSNISVKAETFIKRYKKASFTPRSTGDHFNEYNNDKSYILFSVMLETSSGVCEVPILQEDFYKLYPDLYDGVADKHYIYDPVIASDSVPFPSLNEKRYKLKYPHIHGTPIALWDIKRDPSTNPINLNPITSSLRSTPSIHESYIGFVVGINIFYTIKYPIKVNSQYDTLIGVIMEEGITTSSRWTAVNSAKIAYMLYLDPDKNVQLAIRSISPLDKTNNTLIPFSGKVYGKITMSSADVSYVSPYVFNYSISCS